MIDLTVAERFIEAGGHRLKCTTLGQPDPARPTLVFLHEGLGSISMWKDYPAQVAEQVGLPVLLYDRWGHGESDPLTEPRKPSYRRVEALEVLPEVLAQFPVGPMILIGHSDGGAMSLLYAASHPQRVLGIVGLAPQVGKPRQSAPVAAGASGAMQAVINAFEKGELKRRLERYHGANTERMFYGWANAWSSPEFAGWQMSEELRQIRAPVVVIQGDRDPYGYRHNIEALEQDLAAPLAVHIHSEAGHIPHHEARDFTLEHTVRAIRAFTA